MESLWTKQQAAMFDENLDVRRYIGDPRIDRFPPGAAADISFPNGRDKGTRVNKCLLPTLNIDTSRTSFCVKLRKEIAMSGETQERTEETASEAQKATEARKHNLNAVRKAKEGAASLQEVFDKLQGTRFEPRWSKKRDEVTWGRFSFVVENGEIAAYETRIRKLTPTECYRLMGFTDEDAQRCFDVGQSKSNVYHQAGDSIVVTVLMAIFGSLLGVDYRKKIGEYAEEIRNHVRKNRDGEEKDPPNSC